MDRYHYVIAGGGAAGLSLLVHMIASGAFRDKRILLIDREAKMSNDRTWCFWEDRPGIFEDVVYHRWSKLWFHGGGQTQLHDISPSQYKLIRGIDFYSYCHALIQQQPNIEVHQGTIERCGTEPGGAYVVVDGNRIQADYVFSSVLPPSFRPDTPSSLLQHFKGWVIDLPVACFEPDTATLMDFRVEQVNGDTSFVYVMPFSSTRALVEFTVFGKELLPAADYDVHLQRYCSDILGLTDFTIAEQEFGVIPMTDWRYARQQGNVIYIGTAGGQTKASSGYTFQFIQKHSHALVDVLTRTGKPLLQTSFADRRFAWYDKTLLHVLASHRMPGEQVFYRLMQGNTMRQVFKFLDNETSLLEDWAIIRTLPKRIFLRAALR